ncbi:hypothetical protein [Caldicellulosiruptor morganii]|uniref:Uncharacterized protein n=1 Tax=Caldicellulosiruptor morganii TaxID=1387555 RepID=A0ABY7BN12_9FIRM|nr:hypothetical protein [Caldicellulosiruptor morganii]WAM33697.1 hypothetical protein OTK00_002223 [Caldicellulosiruptor morganii]
MQEWYNRIPNRIFNYKSSIERFFSGDEGDMRNRSDRKVFGRGIGGGVYR